MMTAIREQNIMLLTLNIRQKSVTQNIPTRDWRNRTVMAAV
jgi:hypothetical protein